MTGSDARAGQEAARLLHAAQEWLRTSAPHLAPLAADGAPCSCPVCRAVSGLREADPDSVARWVDSAVAAATALATQAADLAAAATRSAPPPDAGESHDEGGQDEDSEDEDIEDEDTQDEARAGSGSVRAHLTDLADLSDEAPARASAGQDGARSRGVRRIPVEREPGAAAR